MLSWVSAGLATLFTWAMTAAGAALALLVPGKDNKGWKMILGFSAGVMCAASFWSLLLPATEHCASLGLHAAITVPLGTLCGFLLLLVAERCGDRFAMKSEADRRVILMVAAITLHNLPEGLAVGVAFGSCVPGAWALAVGIALQNIPEGFAVAAPLQKRGATAAKSLFWGQLSGAVEPVGGLLGAFLCTTFGHILPFALSFAAGAMLYVVLCQLALEAADGEGKIAGSLGCALGFVVMTVLDLAL